MTDWLEAFVECMLEGRPYSFINHPLIPRGLVRRGQALPGTI